MDDRQNLRDVNFTVTGVRERAGKTIITAHVQNVEDTPIAVKVGATVANVRRTLAQHQCSFDEVEAVNVYLPPADALSSAFEPEPSIQLNWLASTGPDIKIEIIVNR